jgi:cytochrome c oxidase cbb3-type subunit III
VKFALPPLLLAALAGCARAPEPQPPAVVTQARTSDEVEHGRQIYNFRCYFCHGYSGDAQTLAATYLAPPPRNLAAATAESLPRELIVSAVRDGRPGTAMKSFASVLSDDEIEAVARFVEHEFVRGKARNTAYHTVENGWPKHERFAAAFPFATGEIALDAAWEDLTPVQEAGKRLYLSACISCHDRARVENEGPAWTSRPVSFPRAGFTFDPDSTKPVDAISGASAYALHDVRPSPRQHAPRADRGRQLFEANCAFCHGADGTGKNWIGQFMEPPARDLSRFSAATMPRPRLVNTIRDGLSGTSMPSWKDVLADKEIDAIADYVARTFFLNGEGAEAERQTGAPTVRVSASARSPASASDPVHAGARGPGARADDPGRASAASGFAQASAPAR